MASVILWFRSELRLHDNAALRAALDINLPIIPVFIHDSAAKHSWKPGAASQWWLHHALEDLDEQLKSRGSRLILRNGDAQTVLDSLIQETKATHIIWSRSWEPFPSRQDRALAEHFEKASITVSWHEDRYLFSPNAIENQSGKPFQVFTPFWKHCLKLHSFPKPVALNKSSLPAPKRWPQSEPLKALNLLPKISWDAGLAQAWEPTRKSAEALLRSFKKEKCASYATERDVPSTQGTSRLSPYLHFGQIGVREIVHALQGSKSTDCYVSELGWREFAGHLLHHFPKTTDAPLRDTFKDFPWKKNNKLLKAWQEGRTGYPIVDAGMRELWETGWMHNRVRMIAGSVLVKHFLQPWQEGARWFWDTLVDADLASNTLGWQWVAGCGADAAPYFRVFNPVLQGKKFDPEGAYVKRYIPELKGVDKKHIHEPWTLGMHAPKDYPTPIIPVEEGRARALEAYEVWKKRHA